MFAGEVDTKTFKYLGILEAGSVKQVEMKEKMKKEYPRRTRKLIEIKLYGRNLLKGIDIWVVPLVIFSGPFLKWKREDRKQIYQRTRKLMNMHKTLHPIDYVDRLCVKKRGRKSTCRHWKQCWHIDTTTRRLNRKVQKKTDYSHSETTLTIRASAKQK